MISIQVSVIRDPEGLLSIRNEWDCCAQISSGFQSLEWNYAYAKNLMKGELYTLVAREGKKIKVILPLQRQGNIVTSLCDHKTDNNFYYIEDSGALLSLCEFLSTEAVQEIHLLNVIPSDLLIDGAWKEVGSYPCPVVSLSSSWEENVDKGLLRNIEYTERRLKKQGHLSHEFLLPDAETIGLFLRMNRDWWRKRGFPGLSSRQEEERFFMEAVLSMKETIIFSQLSLNEEAISILLLFSAPMSIMYYAGGHVDIHPSCSIGSLHIRTAMHKAVQERKVEKWDFLRGNEKYKYQFGARDDYKVMSLHLNVKNAAPIMEGRA